MILQITEYRESHFHAERYVMSHQSQIVMEQKFQEVIHLQSSCLILTYTDHSKTVRKMFRLFVLLFRENPQALLGTASTLEWLRNLLPHHSQGSSTERWSRNTLRVVIARAFYVLKVFFNVPLYFK